MDAPFHITQRCVNDARIMVYARENGVSMVWATADKVLPMIRKGWDLPVIEDCQVSGKYDGDSVFLMSRHKDYKEKTPFFEWLSRWIK